jgi:hypothetical protein
LQLKLFSDPSAWAGGEMDESTRDALPFGMSQWAEGARWVVKGEIGFGGLAQVRFMTPGSEADWGRIRRVMADCGGGVFERQDAVEEEFGILGQVGASSESERFHVSGLRMHRLLTGPQGSFRGTEIHSMPEAWPQVRDPLWEAANRIGQELGGEGFRGPFGLDAYQYRDLETGELKLRPLVDLNPRPTLASPSHGLAKRLQASLGHSFCMRWRFLLRKQIPSWNLSSAPEAWYDWAGDLAYKPGSDRGWILASPWESGMERLSLVSVGLDAKACLKLESQFLERARGE